MVCAFLFGAILLPEVMYVYVIQQLVVVAIPALVIVYAGAVRCLVFNGKLQNRRSSLLNSLILAAIKFIMFAGLPWMFYTSIHLFDDIDKLSAYMFLGLPFVISFSIDFFPKIKKFIQGEILDPRIVFSKDMYPRYITLHLMFFVVVFASQGGENTGFFATAVSLPCLIAIDYYITYLWAPSENNPANQPLD